MEYAIALIANYFTYYFKVLQDIRSGSDDRVPARFDSHIPFIAK